jgi:hypothetical protein
MLRGFGDVGRATCIHGLCQLSVGFASVYIGVGRGQHNPIRARTRDCIRDLPWVPDVSLLRAEAVHFMVVPHIHQGLAEQTGCSEDGNSHGLNNLRF